MAAEADDQWGTSMRLAAPKSWLGAAAVTLGLGTAALVAGHGVASAETASTPSPSATSAQHSAGPSGRAVGAAAHPRRTAATPTSSATPATRTTRHADVASLPAAVLETPNRAIPAGHRSAQIPSASVASSIGEPKSVNSRHSPAGGVGTIETPASTDAAQTPYGDIGKWMLRSDNGIANWGGVKYQGKAIYEPINVIIVDPTSTTVLESTQRLNSAMVAAGFPAVPLHSTGFAGTVDGITYSQRPAAGGQAFSDAFSLLPNDHGRVFGPAPGPGGAGYVWTASFSRERIGLYRLIPRHVYVSFGRAREAVRAGLVRAGAVDLGLVYLDSRYSTQTATTGDHDGYAAVIVLT